MIMRRRMKALVLVRPYGTSGDFKLETRIVDLYRNLRNLRRSDVQSSLLHSCQSSSTVQSHVTTQRREAIRKKSIARRPRIQRIHSIAARGSCLPSRLRFISWTSLFGGQKPMASPRLNPTNKHADIGDRWSSQSAKLCRRFSACLRMPASYVVVQALVGCGPAHVRALVP